MTNEERVMTLFERANPVPEPERVPPPTTASRYLDDLHRRSSTMTLTTDNDRTDTGATQHQEPRGGSNPRRQWLLVAAVIAVLGLVAGLIFIGNRADEEPVPADEPEPTAPEATVDAEPAAEPEPVPLAQFENFGPGTYDTTLLGVPLTFDTDEAWTTVFFQTGELLFLNPDFETAGVRSWRVTRLGGWHTSDEAGDPEFLEPASIDPYEIESWIGEGYILGEQLPDTVVGGRSTTVYDIQPDPDSGLDAGCPPEQLPCFFPTSVSEESFSRAQARDEFRRVGGPSDAGVETRLWLVAIDGFDPILIDASGVAGWTDTFESTILASIDLGPDGPPLKEL